MEFMIAPGYSKAFQLLAIATFQSTIGMIKRKNYLISYNLMGAIDRAGIRQFFPICFGTGNQSQSMSYGLFIFRVNVVGVTSVYYYSHTGIAYCQCTHLCFTKLCPL